MDRIKRSMKKKISSKRENKQIAPEDKQFFEHIKKYTDKKGPNGIPTEKEFRDAIRVFDKNEINKDNPLAAVRSKLTAKELHALYRVAKLYIEKDPPPAPPKES